MWPLDRPSHTAGQTFGICISRVQDKELKDRLEEVTQFVIDASMAYDVAAASGVLHDYAPQDSVGGLVSTDEMVKVYSQRMASRRAPGRHIYDDIIMSPKHGICPLCGHRSVTTLDHHLPKRRFPVLAVTPLNLVPACSDCNKAKLGGIVNAASELSLHPYYDNIDSARWLTARVLQSAPVVLTFSVEAPGTWTDVLRERVKRHFLTLGLERLYGTQAAEELSSIRYQLSELYRSGGSNFVRSWLADRASSCLLARRNGWRTAAYEAWADSNWFCDGGFAPEG